jgi:menaquinone-dependent protoporphyrinogen oxidase
MVFPVGVRWSGPKRAEKVASRRRDVVNVLIVVASKHGSTWTIGVAIAAELVSMGIDADVVEPTEETAFGPYDAAIVGSAVYMGRWLPEAAAFVRDQEAALQSIPVWLFSSGPLGDAQPQPPGDPRYLDELMVTAGARGHRLFSGCLEKDQLGLGERLVARAVHAPMGDFRDWDAIRDWAREIGESLQTERHVSGEGSAARSTAQLRDWASTI